VRRAILSGLFLCGFAAGFCPDAAADDVPCVSGLKVGQRPGPYSAIVATGEHRGQPHCFICETADRPAVIVFARTLSDSLGKLAARLDRTLAENRATELRGWVTVLAAEEASATPDVVTWARKHAIRTVPLAVFEDPLGPPSYRLSKDADVTVLLSVKQKVQRNFAFRPGELNEERIAEIVKAIPDILPAAKKEGGTSSPPAKK
jgi:hypothetical protein